MVSRFERLMGCSSIPIGETSPETVAQCSGRGDCLNGTCLCEIRYSGEECSGFNLPYHAGKLLIGIDRFYCFASTIFINSLIRFSPPPSCRHFGRLLLRGLCVAGAADDLHHRRVPAAEAAQLSGRLPADHPEAAVLFRLHCGGPARRLLYHTGKGTVPCFVVVVVVIVAFSLFYANFYPPLTFSPPPPHTGNATTGMGVVSDVAVLSARHDLRLARGVPVGRGKCRGVHGSILCSRLLACTVVG